MEIHKDKKLNLQISLKAHIFPLAMLLQNYLVLRTDLYNVCRQRSEHIFRPNGSYCLIFNLSFRKMDGEFVCRILAEFNYDEHITKVNKRWRSHQNTNSGKKRTQFLVIP